MKTFKGRVWEREFDTDMGCDMVPEVSNGNDDFSDILAEFVGKKVAITIMEIEPDLHEKCISCKFFDTEKNFCKERKTTVFPNSLNCYKWRYFA